MAERDAFLEAAAVMTAWTMQQDSTDFASGIAAEHLVGPDDGAGFVGGMLGLCGRLLLRAAVAEGESGQATPDEMRAVLRDIVERHIGPPPD